MMQSLGRMYVMYFNRSYKRTGTLWEGRFKSCLVQEETYLMQVYRYIVKAWGSSCLINETFNPQPTNNMAPILNAFHM
jgi:putative transposase